MPKDYKKKQNNKNSSINNQDNNEFKTLKQLMKYFFPRLYEEKHGIHRNTGGII